jgi:hypothetical protein
MLSCVLAMDADAQEPVQTAESTCVIELRLPTYSDLTWKAQLTGKASVSITIDAKGSPSISVENVHAALKALMMTQLKESKFDPLCAGKTLHYTFEFRLSGPQSATLAHSVVYRPPNSFVITARPPVPFTSPAGSSQK